MNIIYRLAHYLLARDMPGNDPLADMSLRERADMPTWHEDPTDACQASEVINYSRNS